jgi:hypothetical protein
MFIPLHGEDDCRSLENTRLEEELGQRFVGRDAAGQAKYIGSLFGVDE